MPRLAQLNGDRQEGERGQRCREQYRREPLRRAARRRRESPRLSFNRDQVVVVGDEQDGVARRHAEQSDEAHHRPKRQRVAGDRHRGHAAEKRARQRDEHEEHVAAAAEGQRQQQHDQHEGSDCVQQQIPCRSRYRGSFAAVAQINVGGQLHLRRHRLSCGPCVARLIGGLRIRDDDLAAQPALMVDEAACRHQLEGGDGGQPHQRAVTPA